MEINNEGDDIKPTLTFRGRTENAHFSRNKEFLVYENVSNVANNIYVYDIEVFHTKEKED